MYRYITERRGFSMIQLTEADLATPLDEATDEQLKAHYDAHIDRFTKPESKRIGYALLLPDMIAADQPVDEAVLKKMYDDRLAEFVQPERRLVERLVYADAAARDAAEAALKAGSQTFEQLVEARGLTLDAIDLGDVSETDLGAAGAAIFAAANGDVVSGDSNLGPALFRVNGVLEGQNTTFDEAKEELAGELKMDAARRAIADKVEQIDDLLAGGATLEDLAKEMAMEFSTLDHVPGQQGTEPVEGYQAFRTAAETVKQGDFPEAIVLEDGGVVALEFKETVPAAPIPFDEAQDKVAEDWRKEALAKALSAQAVAFKAAAVRTSRTSKYHHHPKHRRLASKAGSTHVVEMHGTLRTLSCTQCYKKFPSEEYLKPFIETGTIPQCPNCNATLKPDVILFGEQLPQAAWQEAQRATRQCDLMLVAGSSLEVLPVASLPIQALDHGAHLIIINDTTTYVNVRADIVITENVATIIPEIMKRAIHG